MLQSVIVSVISRHPTKALMKILAVFLCPLVTILSLAYAQTAHLTSKIESSGETVIAAHSRGISVQVKITTHEVQIGKPSVLSSK
jgi:hypothetical protein